jgi:hypothetical protein
MNASSSGNGFDCFIKILFCMAVSKQNSVERVKHTMELDDKIDMHKKGWKIQRVGWVVILALMFAAALGVFGEGVASKRQVDLGNAQVKYDRFFRYEAEMMLQFMIREGSDSALISFSQDYLKGFRIEQIVPGPKENYMHSGKVYYVFKGSAPMKIVFYMVPEQAGSVNGEVGVNDARFNLSQFIYP